MWVVFYCEDDKIISIYLLQYILILVNINTTVRVSTEYQHTQVLILIIVSMRELFRDYYFEMCGERK